MREQRDEARQDAQSRKDIVRVLSFGSGGFDTTMQLGCVHALVTIRGKAPDAVVGLSAGAINAVALAEVLQAGDEHEDGGRTWATLGTDAARARHQRRRLEARVACFRKFLDRLFRAPQELIDGVLPDAYQVDARKPLQTVHAPIFVEAERNRRNEAVANRTGLIRLYNHVLGLRMTFGTITRITRRVLGFVAAGEMQGRLARGAVRAVEAVRIWMHVGSSLGPLARLIPLVAFPPLRQWFLGRIPEGMRSRMRRVHGYTAGAIIFRFPLLEAAARELRTAVVFIVVLTLWVGITLGPFLLSWYVAGLTSLTPWEIPASTLYAGLLALLTVLAVIVWPSFRDFDRTTLWRSLVDLVKAGTFALGIVALWTSVLFGLLVLVGMARAAWFGGASAVPPSVSGLRTATEGMRVIASGGGLVALVLMVGIPIVLKAGSLGARPAAGRGVWRGWMRSLLDVYHIRSSIFSSYPLERFFSGLFDPGYWGVPDMDEVVEDSLKDRLDPWPGGRKKEPPRRKELGDYDSPDRAEPIRVGLTAADLSSGKLEVLEPHVSVVAGLTAANAVVPFFPPKRLCKKLYVDGANVSNEPMQGVLDVLRNGADRGFHSAHVYAVAPFPTSPSDEGRKVLDDEGRTVRNGDDGARAPLDLVKATNRARRLRRLRDATLERRLTELYSEALPSEGDGVFSVPGAKGGTDTFLRVWVTPVEPERAVRLNERVFRANRKQVRQMVLETIADGCRASLEVMIRPSMPDAATTVRCCDAVRRHLRSRVRRSGDRTLLPVIGTPLPGSAENGGPGLRTICAHCALDRDAEGDARQPQTLRFEPKWKSLGPSWPLEREACDDGHGERYRAHEPTHVTAVQDAVDELVESGRGNEDALWPEPREQYRPEEQPVRSLLFSGGVFRGVFQMGVLNALADVGLKPDLIAGASVGSITAAMTAGVFSHEGPERARLVAQLAAVYIALDRLILTDRFADFIRNVTVRAAEARFSIRQADRVFRRFDAADLASYGSDVRRVLAGVERLFYLSPFEVLEVVRAIRHRDFPESSRLLLEHAQEWLDRMAVGDEVLGAEPLRRLIGEYVHGCLDPKSWEHGDGPSFDDLREHWKIHFLATATNLTEERLEILGLSPRQTDADGSPSLREGLLASSAFPGIFRARMAHEVYPGTVDDHQYVDGGIIDNLPLDAMAEFLRAASHGSQRLVARRPRQGGRPRPHLVFAASLEVQARPADEPDDLSELSWPELLERTRQLGYNRKLNQYHGTHRNLRAVQAAIDSGALSSKRDLVPLDLEFVVVKPNWLCKTFAFHPMLGFRRERQIRSIAHGCASTLLELASRKEESEGQVRAWGIDVAAVPNVTTFRDAFGQRERRPSKSEPGTCWLRPGRACPFSEQATRPLGLADETREQLARIHELCHEPRTHGV